MMCPDCPVAIEARGLVLGSDFWLHLAYASIPIVGVLGVVWWTMRRADPLVAAGLVLGIGLGGFVDGILLHQILQWHNMLSSLTPPTTLVTMKYNMVWDGLFHALTWLLCVAGVILLFRASRRSTRWSGAVLLGSMLGGWGVFNLVEGLIDHQIFGLHHLHPGNAQAAWDWAFVLIGGVGFALAGFVIARRAMIHRAP